jgi:Ca2+-transporting ATPase
VIREGQRRRIAGREVVRGDLVVLAEGDRVPADALLLKCINLTVDESLLTGESVPVRKATWDGSTKLGRPGGDDLPFVYSGTLLFSGSGIARVEATGLETEIGKIGKSLQRLETETTRLQQETGRVVRVMAALGLSLCAIVAVIYGLTRRAWLQGFLAGTALAISMVPEEFPVVLTVFLAVGAWRISKKQVLTRRISAVEALGAATVLCVDKTGTLTLNRMSVVRFLAGGHLGDLSQQPRGPLPEAFHEIVEYSILASRRDPFDPMEIAFKQMGDHYLAETEHLHKDWVLVREYPLSPQLLAISRVWAPGDHASDSDRLVVAAKGAPEAVADLCHLGEAQRQEMAGNIANMAKQGLRVLGVAEASFRNVESPSELPADQHGFNFEWVGLVGLADPVRPTVPAALEECDHAGVRVVMITGDYPETARSIARQIGLKGAEEVVSGPELDKISETDLQQLVKKVNIFARVVPEQKLRLVNALKANGEIVAMTGDGVNDAPALKAAHIGIAMGGRGTDVAREAAALVLLDDDFSSIVQAIRSGRRIFDNLKKAMAFVLAIHVPIAGVSLVPVLFRLPLVLFPVHIVFLEFITDPACSIAFEAEPEESDVMRRPPRDPGEPLFNRRILWLSLLQGASVLAVSLGVFVIAIWRGQGELDARALTFTTLVLSDLGLVFTNRSWSHTIFRNLRAPNPALWWLTAGALAVLGLVLYAPFLRAIFRFSTLHAVDLVICLGAAMVSVAWFEAWKRIKGWARPGLR